MSQTYFTQPSKGLQYFITPLLVSPIAQTPIRRKRLVICHGQNLPSLQRANFRFSWPPVYWRFSAETVIVNINCVLAGTLVHSWLLTPIGQAKTHLLYIFHKIHRCWQGVKVNLSFSNFSIPNFYYFSFSVLDLWAMNRKTYISRNTRTYSVEYVK